MTVPNQDKAGFYIALPAATPGFAGSAVTGQYGGSSRFDLCRERSIRKFFRSKACGDVTEKSEELFWTAATSEAADGCCRLPPADV